MSDRNLMLLSKIRTDGGTQARAAIRPEVVNEYAEGVESGDEFPPVVLFEDEAEHLWLADGFHRYAAYKQAKKNSIPAEIRKGTLRDAQLFAAGCNDKHGLRRSNEDKRAAVELLLKDAEWAKATDRWIAEQCGVTHPFVAKCRPSTNGTADGAVETVTTVTEPASTGKRTARDGRQVPAHPSPILCQRCQGLGQETPATGCSKCQAERAKAKHEKKKARKKKKAEQNGQPTEVLDDFKNPVPKKRLAAWSDPWIQETFDTLSVALDQLLQARMAAGMNKRAKHFPFFDAKDFCDGYGFATNYIDQLIQHLKTFRPAGVCPCCEGVGCGECRQAGLVPREVYKTLKEKMKGAKK